VSLWVLNRVLILTRDVLSPTTDPNRNPNSQIVARQGYQAHAVAAAFVQIVTGPRQAANLAANLAVNLAVNLAANLDV
jgi:hypothetical protein